MPKILTALCITIFLVACGDDSSSVSASVPSSETSSSNSIISNNSEKSSDSKINDKIISSSSASEANRTTTSSTTSDSNISSSSVIKSIACKTETEDNCVYDSIIDERDGQTYKTVKIGNQWWMAENLNYADSVKTPSLRERNWCYNDSAKYCAKYGRLYTWAAAIDSSKLYDSGNGVNCGDGIMCTLPEKIQGLCPNGWHLPKLAEWEILFAQVGGDSIAGKILMSQKDWTHNENGSDIYGFNALPAGGTNLKGQFNSIGDYTFFWIAETANEDYAYYVCLYYEDERALLIYSYKKTAHSVRCVKDTE